MPSCQKCDQKWSWKQTLKKSFTLDTGMICPYCKKKQYITKGTMIKNTLITFMAMTVMTIWSLFFGSSFGLIAISISFVPLFVMLYPFWVELSNKENI
jgi:CXXC-20-CXXC protein